MNRQSVAEPTAEDAPTVETQHLVADVLAAIDALAPVLEEETALVRAGRLAEAAALQPRKAELAASYLTAGRRLRNDAARRGAPAPAALAAARERHDALRALLQMNMTVIATAHAVAEGLIRGAVAEASRRKAPSTYGAAGRPREAPARSAQPVVFNRNC